MLKVVIADDEAHICRLIEALVDWNSMNMEVVGVASNGIEAIELVNNLLPDILITDIRMPGCNGLELIQNVKTSNSDLEVIIISGYAHFPYAQTAMRYGVGNYLLKPINKVELIQTLQKIEAKIRNRIDSEVDIEKMIQNNQNVQERMKNRFIEDLIEGKAVCDSEDTLFQEYGLKIHGGAIQTFCIKMDYDVEKVGEKALSVAKDKIQNIIAGNLKELCSEYIFEMDDFWGYGVLNYEKKKQEDVRRIMRHCLNQLVVQKGILGPVEFTFSVNVPIKNLTELGTSLLECKEIAKERIVIGAERIIETVPKERGLKGKNLLEGYSRIITHAVETLDKEEADKSLQFLQQVMKEAKNLRGYEVLELVISAGTLFLMQRDLENQKELIEKFVQKCEQSSSINMLLQNLDEIHKQVIGSLQLEHDNEILHPIRMAKKYIQNHYQDQITLEEVSLVVGLSASYFSGLFKKETGEGFAKYLINIRVEAAKTLLRETNQSISSICKDVGYNDLKHFTATFVKTTGLKPSAYRKLYG